MPALLLAALAACSQGKAPQAPGTTSADEARALSDARSMIPAAELSASPEPSETAR
ncbi:hypothetical protein ACOYW6_08850 [Parablastomonas sp. CN1-191]|uniref:hypothetical protein n=1 Tax=Parablastomonas sp. CN1-191 TaxID=3400908 RepID=UPI003BF79DB6